MAIYPPPTENPPIFNELDFDKTIDQQHLDQNYLRLLAQTEEDMNGFEITNLGPATSGSGAARLDQVTGTGAFLPLTGGSMAGVIDMNQSNIDMYATGGGTGGGDIEMRNGQINACNSLNATSVVASGSITSGTLTSTGPMIVDFGTSGGAPNLLYKFNGATKWKMKSTGQFVAQKLIVGADPPTGGVPTMVAGDVAINDVKYRFPPLVGNPGDVLAQSSGGTGILEWTQHPVSNQVIHQSGGVVGIAGTALLPAGTNAPQNINVGATAPSTAATINIGTGDLTANNLALAGAIEFAGNVDISCVANGTISIGNDAGTTAQGADAVAIGNTAGNNAQGANAVAIGNDAGIHTQASNAVAIGYKSGETTQSNFSVAIGSQAGSTNQGNGGGAGIAIGKQAGQNTQGPESIAIGIGAAGTNQGNAGVAIGFEAGQTSQGNFTVAIGVRAGQTSQGNSSIAIGDLAGTTNQGAKTIVLNATGLNSDYWDTPGGGTNGPTSPDRTYIAPIQQQANLNSDYKILCYNLGTKEVRYMQWSSFPNTPATTKTFCIDHPVKEDYKLLHSCIESPQIDLNYRGKIKLKDGYGEVNIDEKFKMENGTFEALCRDIQVFTSNETGWTAVRGKMEGNILQVESAPNGVANDDTISWLVIGERKDEELMSDIKTDEEGKLITEQDYSTAKNWKSNC
tara:strand:- start:455 stop:2503 length:2049 start_codon:yes stop_codon:yes gene_type:complete